MNFDELYDIIAERRDFEWDIECFSEAGRHQISFLEEMLWSSGLSAQTHAYARKLFGDDFWRYAFWYEYIGVISYSFKEVSKEHERKIAEIKKLFPHIVPLNPEKPNFPLDLMNNLKVEVSSWMSETGDANGAWRVFSDKRKPYIAFDDADTAFFFRLTFG